MTADQRKELVKDLRDLANRLETGREITAEKALLGRIAVQMLDGVGAGSFARNMLLNALK